MTKPAPLVSVVIPTRGRPQLVRRAVQTVLDQTFADFEIIVRIDGEDPASEAALADISDPRLRVLAGGEQLGAGRNRDAAMRAGTGRWIAFLDDDDEWLPAKLERQMAVAGDGRTIVTTLSRVVTPFGELIHPTRPYDGQEPIDEWLFGRRTWFKGGEAMIQTSSLLIPRALFDRIGFGNAFHEEWELTIRAVKQFGYRLETVREPLVIYQTGNSYPWRPSIAWIDSVRDVVTPRAYAGFCLTTATQGLSGPERNRAALTLLGKALRRGRPTAKQLFAFGFIWLLPAPTRHRIRTMLARRHG